MAVVTAADAKNQHQNNDQQKHCFPLFVLVLKLVPVSGKLTFPPQKHDAANERNDAYNRGQRQGMVLVAGHVERPDVYDGLFRRVGDASPDNADQAQRNQNHSDRSVHVIELSNPEPNLQANQGASQERPLLRQPERSRATLAGRGTSPRSAIPWGDRGPPSVHMPATRRLREQRLLDRVR